MHSIKYIALMSLIVMLSAVHPLRAETFDKIKFVKISAQDQKAVLKDSDGKLKMIGVGDVVGGDSKVVEIAKDRVVLEKMTDAGIEIIIVRLINGEQKVERVTKAGDKQPLYGSKIKVEKQKEQR